MLRFEGGAEYAREIADALRHQEVMLHQPLDAMDGAMVAIAETARNVRLQVEGQPLLGPPRDVMQHEAHGPYEGAGFFETQHLARREDATFGQLGDVVDLIEILRDPVESVQIAQAAFSLLN